MLGSGIQNLIDNSVTDDQSGTTENLFFFFFWGEGEEEGEGERGVVIRINLQGKFLSDEIAKQKKGTNIIKIVIIINLLRTLHSYIFQTNHRT